jgi:hypothetical protein
MGDVNVNSNYMVIAGREEVYVVDNNHSLIGIQNKYNLNG